MRTLDFVWSKPVTLIYIRVSGAPKLHWKNIRLAVKYYKFGWDSASRKKIRRRRRGLVYCLCVVDSWIVTCSWCVLDVVRTPKASDWTPSAFNLTTRDAFQPTPSSRPAYPSNYRNVVVVAVAALVVVVVHCTCLKPSTHRQRDETVESRRVSVGGVFMNSRRLPTDSAMRTQPSAVTQFTILQPMA